MSTNSIPCVSLFLWLAVLVNLGRGEVVESSSPSVVKIFGFNNQKIEIQIQADQRLTISDAIRKALGTPNMPPLQKVKLVRKTSTSPTGYKTIFTDLSHLDTPEGRKRDLFVRATDRIIAPTLRLPPSAP